MTSKFRLIPAIDLLGGRVVRLYKGAYDAATVYNEDPAAPIRQFADEGAELVHIVDLDAARQGDRSANRAAIDVIIAAARERGVALELGGGVRDRAALEHYFSRGVDRLILGTAAVKRPEFASEAVREFGAARIIIGVDALDGVVRVSGWEESGGVRVEEFLKDLEQRGVEEIIFTDIARDGALSGPAVDWFTRIHEISGLRMIASGGVASLADIETLLALRLPRLVGAISGKAIYEQKLSVKAAVELCRRSTAGSS